MEYQEVKTKKEYLNLLDKVREESRILAERNPSMKIYESIFNQLSDVKRLLDSNHIFSESEIYTRYSFGAIAVKNFDCDNELYGRELQDLFGGLFDFAQMPK